MGDTNYNSKGWIAPQNGSLMSWCQLETITEATQQIKLTTLNEKLSEKLPTHIFKTLKHHIRNKNNQSRWLVYSSVLSDIYWLFVKIYLRDFFGTFTSCLCSAIIVFTMKHTIVNLVEANEMWKMCGEIQKAISGIFLL